MVVKDNQPRLLTDVAQLFSRPPGPGQDLRRVQQVSKGHGRLETRTLSASADLAGYVDWPGVAQGLCLERTILRLATGETTHERVYAITSLRPEQLDLAKLLTRWRGHWGIENRLHWVKDVVCDEDASRVRSGQAPTILVILRNAVVSWLRTCGYNSLTAGRRHFALHLDEALASVGIV